MSRHKGRKTEFQRFESLMAKADYLLKQKEKEDKARINKKDK